MTKCCKSWKVSCGRDESYRSPDDRGIANLWTQYINETMAICVLTHPQRRDLALKYTILMADIGRYAEDGAQLLIKHGWLEQPPLASDRNELAEK